jgi:DNA-binding NtrC family response regulator
MNADLEWLQAEAQTNVHAQSILARLQRAGQDEAAMIEVLGRTRETLYDVIANAGLSREWWDHEGLDVMLYDAIVGEFGVGGS